ncbi:hypothetical protein VKT23_001120 [Stygiomarasmius scandens]|uniref:Uncharacterized protein n=1 Tax=Marasmiellus scandens TaxID=2682957 RepID=A0ABR1K826_9AGAR
MSILNFACSAVIKPLLRISHSVAEEVFSSFAVFVLSTALSLFAASAEVKPDEVSNPRLNFAMIFWIRVIVISMFTLAISDDNATTPNTGTAKKVSASKLLVQVPDAAQRRMSCPVSFVHAQAEDEV